MNLHPALIVAGWVACIATRRDSFWWPHQNDYALIVMESDVSIVDLRVGQGQKESTTDCISKDIN